MGRGTKRSDLTALQRAGLEHLEACAREGVTIQAYARRRRLSAQRLYQLANVLRGKGLLPQAARGGRKTTPQRVRAERKPRFVEVQASAAPHERSDSPPTTWRAQLPNGVVLEGSSDLDRVVVTLAKL
jgi:hypothetical protein